MHRSFIMKDLPTIRIMEPISEVLLRLSVTVPSLRIVPIPLEVSPRYGTLITRISGTVAVCLKIWTRPILSTRMKKNECVGNALFYVHTIIGNCLNTSDIKKVSLLLIMLYRRTRILWNVLPPKLLPISCWRNWTGHWLSKHYLSNMKMLKKTEWIKP